MEEILTLRIPSNIQQRLNRTPEELSRDLQLYAALMMFRLGKLSSGAAAELAGVPRVTFLDLCAEYGIAISQITPDDLRQEVLRDKSGQ
jgi:predicted HTH domain antitoxin